MSTEKITFDHFWVALGQTIAELKQLTVKGHTSENGADLVEFLRQVDIRENV